MAPRRTRKVGLKRIDAAIDKFTDMGFSTSLIRRKVKDLLTLYGGDDGWVFIEDGDYSLLLETLLEEKSKQDIPLLEDGFSRDEKDDYSRDESVAQEGFEEQEKLSSAGPSNWPVEPVCSEQDFKLENPGAVNIPPIPPPEEQRHLSGSSLRKFRPCFGWISNDDNNVDLQYSKDGSHDEITAQNSFKQQAEPSNASPSNARFALVCSKQDNEVRNCVAVDVLRHPSLAEQQHLDGSRVRRRTSSLGWVSSHKNDNDFVLLTPYPVHSDRIINRKKERVRRWDQAPSDTQGSHLMST
ncbi:hypothetical protein Ancab_014636 [Ancistrocladus abbreviatus]